MRRFLAIACLLLAGLRSQAAPPVTPCYTITDLGAFETDALNDRDQVVGSIATPQYRLFDGVSQQTYDAALWQHGKLLDLGTVAPYPNSYATGINDKGQIVGVLDDTTDGAILDISRHPFLWQHGRMRDIGVPGGDERWEATAINDQGDVVGWGAQSGWPETDDPNTQPHALLYHNNRWRALDTLEEALAVNNAGQIVGYGMVENDPKNQHALLWDNSRTIDLGTGRATNINRNGQTAVERYSSPYTWWRGVVTPLPFSGNQPAHVSVEGINDRGDVVGSDNASPNGHALLWLHSHEIRLGAYISRNAGWTLLDATGINNRGQIVGNGLHHGKPRAFLLTPLPTAR